MRVDARILAVIFLAISSFGSIYAQQCPPAPLAAVPPSLNECQVLANGKGQFWRNETGAGVSLRLYIIGKRDDIKSPYAGKDVLIMSIGYYAPDKKIPNLIELKLTAFSTTSEKYNDNPKLTIYLDDKPLLSKEADATEAIKTFDMFTFLIRHGDFVKFTEAKNTTIELGETKIKLKSEDIQALNELNTITKVLKFPSPF